MFKKFFVPIYPLDVPMVGLEPLILGSRVEFSTTELMGLVTYRIIALVVLCLVECRL
jgi:hypothetical protein